MMRILDIPNVGSFSRPDLEELLKRPSMDSSLLEKSVTEILQQVKERGDIALQDLTLKFDKVSIDDFSIPEIEIKNAEKLLQKDLVKAIRLAAKNIKKFHKKQLTATQTIVTMKGVKCWRKSVAIEKVGLYIPAGTAPLFSTILMLGIPAQIAGCNEIVMCSPPGADGKLHPAMLFAARVVGISRIFKVGGVQAIAAMTYGTETIPRVYKLFGPGNQYVTCAKQLLHKNGVAIDIPAGPSEVCVIADKSANPAFVAADLLSQAEHGPDSQVLLVSDSRKSIEKVAKELENQLKELPRREIAAKALENSKAILVKNIREAVLLVNEYAPEHLVIHCKKEDAVAKKIINAGSVFIGQYSPESVGDYASGTNHTLPTNGYAKAYSGVSVDSFVKKITYQKLSAKGLKNIGRAVEAMAEAEGLIGHKNAVRIRNHPST